MRAVRVGLARHPQRPYFLDYAAYLCPDFTEIHGDRKFGDDPAIVMQRIADFRADDKPDPEYYARHTVYKAQEALERSAIHKIEITDETQEPNAPGGPMEGANANVPVR